MREGLYLSNISPDKVGAIDGMMADEYLGVMTEVVRGWMNIVDAIRIGVAAFNIQKDRINIIFIMERFANDCGDETVAGWTVFVEVKRQDLTNIKDEDLMMVLENMVIRVIKAHNISVRTLINDFYHNFVVRDGDVESIRNHMVAVWRMVIRHKPTMAKKPSWFKMLDTIQDVVRTKAGADEMIASYEYLNRGEAHDLREVRKTLDFSKMRFLFYIRNLKAEKTYLGYAIDPSSSHPIVVVSLQNCEARGCYFLPYNSVDDLRDIFWWLTTTDEEYGRITTALKREFNAATS